MSNSDEKRLLVKRNKGKSGMYYLTALCPRDLSEISEDCFDLPFLNPKELIRSNSCGGLLFFYDLTGHSYLCNPTTKQIQIFPPKEASPNPNCKTRLAGACVGYDSKSNDYKILRIWDRNYYSSPSGHDSTDSRDRGTDSRDRTFELYSFSGDSWEQIPSPAKMCTSGIENVIYARGKFYWISRVDSRVVSFDSSKKSFSYLPLPRKADCQYFSLFKFNDDDDDDSLGIAFRGARGVDHKLRFHLSFGTEPGFYIEVWVLSEGWDKMFSVSLGGGVTGVETIHGPFLFLHGMADGPAHYDCLDRLVVYDWSKKECRELGISNYDSAIDVFCYVESNVALPHGRPIDGSSPVLNSDYSDEDEECSSPYDSSNEAQVDDFDFNYDSSCEASEANFDDFAVNGFRVVDDIELELELEEEEIGGPQGMDNDLHGKSLGVSSQLKTAGTKRARNPDARGNIVIPGYTNAKFFIIKSDSEDDVRKSIMYNIWSCTPYGNKKLNAAYEDAKRVADEDARGRCPVFLIFSVNASGHYCGVAEMTGPVDFNSDTDFWLRSGYFPVKWLIIKDLSNSNFRHKILQNMPVTDCRDMQRISYRKGEEMLKIFQGHTSETSLLSYEHKQSRKRVREQRRVD